MSVVQFCKGKELVKNHGNYLFEFELPKDGLALHSAGIVDGVPELRFNASPKVPTILEEDVATAFRLVLEGKRPEFFYLTFPPTHPLHLTRFFTLYCPMWLQWTAAGKHLAETDWSMKGLSLGTRSNEEKSSFKSWADESKLIGLETHVAFPQDDTKASIIMSCESAKVQKSDSEIVFPEEPKMKITDGCSSLYSKYITQIYQSVAYYDEPKFLKMQELIKLILAVEWLYKEKGVRVSQEWIMKHTCKKTDTVNVVAKPPDYMIPKPVHFKPPRRYVPSHYLKTQEAKMYKTLETPETLYGCHTVNGAEAIMFKEDGTQCSPLKCLKLNVECKLSLADNNIPAIEMQNCCYLPLPEQKVFEPTALRDELLSKNQYENIVPFPELDVSLNLIEAVVEDISDEGGVEVRITRLFQLGHLPLLKMTTVMAVTQTAKEDPQKSLLLEIPDKYKAIVPEGVTLDAEVWNELISELTVPIPCAWWGTGEEPVAQGGVSTHNFRVNEVPLQRRASHQKTQWKDNYTRRGQQLVVRAQHITNQGSIQLLNCSTSKFSAASHTFTSTWTKGTCPPITCIFLITNSSLEQEWTTYRRHCQSQEVEKHFHGTSLSCNITASKSLCNNGNCGICGISCAGLDDRCIGKNIDFQRFGQGFYLAPNSSKCHDYTEGANGLRAMLLCDVCPGRKYLLQTNSQNLTGPPPGFDSVYGQVSNSSVLNYPEIVLYDQHAVMPRYIIVYKKDGVQHPLANGSANPQ